MKELVLYIHGKGGNPGEAGHYRPLFPEAEVVGLDYKAQTPWEARAEFPPLFDRLSRPYSSVTLIANSIGAFFAMNALSEKPVKRAFFLSPVVDMERLVADMMQGAGVSEEELRRRGEIATPFGETLSWAYLCDVRAHPLTWTAPTAVLYGGRDALVARDTVISFARRTGASLTVMENGEHWFHTDEQMAFLDGWIRAQTGQKKA